MKEIIYSQVHPNLGVLRGVCRILGKFLYFKFNNTEQANNMIAQLEQRGALIEQAGGWIKVFMFTKGEIYKLGGIEFNINEKSEEEMEQILYNFYYNQFTRMGFKIE